MVGFINAPKPVHNSFKRKIWLYDGGNFDEYRRLLEETDWNEVISTGNIDKITSNISGIILHAAETTIPNRIVTIRKSDLCG